MATPSTGAQAAQKKAQPPAPKILRVGIIQGGRIIEERLLRARNNVSVGQAARNTFVIPSPVLPRSYQLFEVSGDSYTVKFTDAMDGRVSIGGKVHTFLQVKQSGRATKKGPIWHLKLEPGARGKVVLGDVTVLYQFVTAPPVRPKARLPASIRGSITSGMDWLYSVVFIGSAGLHLLLAIIFLVMDKPKHVSGSRFKNLVRVEIKRRVEQFKKKSDTDGREGPGAEAEMGEMAGDEMKEESRARGRGRKGPRDDGRKGPRIDKESEDSVVDAMMGQAVNADSAAQGFSSVAIGAKCVGAECRNARSGSDILSSGKAGTGLDGSASSFGGATGSGPGGPGGSTRGRGGRFRRGRGGVGRGIGGGRGSGRGPVRISRPRGPRPRVGASVPTPRMVNMTLAAKIRRRIASKARALKYLYNQRLQSGAKFKCRVKISFLLQKNGRVGSVGVAGGCPAGFISAIKSRVKGWRLPPGVTQFIRFTVSFSY